MSGEQRPDGPSDYIAGYVKKLTQGFRYSLEAEPQTIAATSTETSSEDEYTVPRVELADGSRIPAPMALAEQLHADKLAELHSAPWLQGGMDKLFRMGCVHLELAHCVSDSAAKEAHLAEACRILGAAASTSSHHTIRSNRLLTFMPLFTSRVNHAQYASADMQKVYHRQSNRALALAKMRTSNFGTFYEDVFLALCAGIGDHDYLAWPTTSREENASPLTENYNHDVYIIRNPKLALQLKGKNDGGKGNRYESPVHKVAVRSIIYAAAIGVWGTEHWEMRSRSGHTGRSMPIERMHELFELTGKVLVADASGSQLTEQEAEYVRLLKTYTKKRIDDVYEIPPKNAKEYDQ